MSRWLACWLLALFAGAAQAQSADTILLGGKIVTCLLYTSDAADE